MYSPSEWPSTGMQIEIPMARQRWKLSGEIHYTSGISHGVSDSSVDVDQWSESLPGTALGKRESVRTQIAMTA